MAELIIEVQTEETFDFPLQETAEAVCAEVLRSENCPYSAQISLLITGPQEIRELNRDFRGIDRETDVLSFPGLDFPEPSDFSSVEDDRASFIDPDTGDLLLGDIVLNAARVKSQARDYGHSERREYAFLIAHSMLHLCGYDHMTEDEAAVMEEKQERVLKTLGITREDPDAEGSGRANRTDVIVIGAGASGCMAAIAAASQGASVILLEKGDRIGRKLHATGNGRCNLTNLVLGVNFYHTSHEAAADVIAPHLERFAPADLCRFWEERGIFFHDRNGYVYPRTDQASTIVDALDKELSNLGVEVVTEADVRSVHRTAAGSFDVRTADGTSFPAEIVILSTGGLAGPQYGCSGDGYRIAGELGHRIADPVPALVPLISEDPSLRFAAGVRADAEVTLLTDGIKKRSVRGEVQFTSNSLSGIPVFQLSGAAARAMAEGRETVISVDLLPEFREEMWEREKERRLGEDRKQQLSALFLGLVNRKLLDMLLAREGLQAENKAYKLSEERLHGLMDRLRDLRFPVTGTAGYGKAQTTSGGVEMSGIGPALQSLEIPGLYITGELLDVDGDCGGYNLHWAMASGYLAGTDAGRAAVKRKESHAAGQ